MRTRWLSLAATVLTSITLILVAASPVHAAPSQPVLAHIMLASGKQVDLSHPEKANYPCPGMAHSGVSPVGRGPQFNCTQHNGKGGITPDAGNESGNCTNGITYLQGFQNPPGFPNQKIYTFYAASPYPQTSPNPPYENLWYLNGYYVTASVTAYVKYYWCPSSHFASGSINYSNTYIAPTVNGDCINTETGGYGGVGANDYGADMHTASGQYYYLGDGEPYHMWTNICPGNYIWDYSSLGDGSQSWYAQLLTSDQSTSDALVQTPWAQ